MKIAEEKTITSGIENTVEVEISGGYEKYAKVEGKLKESVTDTMSVTYSKAMGLEYDLSKIYANSVKIAAMGYIFEYRVFQYKNSHFVKDYTTYAFDKDWGKEIRLVCRY